MSDDITLDTGQREKLAVYAGGARLSGDTAERSWVVTSVITPNRAVFLVDDQPDIRLLWRLSIEMANHGLRVVGEAGSGNDALAALDGIAADVFVIDHMMPGMSGLELAEQLRERAPGGVLILCTAYLDDELQRRAVAVGIDHCLAKEQQGDLPDIILGVG